MASLDRTLVFFDLVESGPRFPRLISSKRTPGSGGGDIIQLAAVSGSHNFNVYIMPQGDIDGSTTEFTGFRVLKGKLSQDDSDGATITTVTLHTALTSFITFLRSLKLPVLLAAHKTKNKLVLDRALFRCSLTEQFQQLGPRFLDTYRLSGALFPGLDSYEQTDLSYPFLGKIDINKNALRGVTALQALYGFWNPVQESVTQFSS